MPIYEYACKSCSHTLDALQKMSEEPLKRCPACGEATLKRLISAPRFRLKGKGWYETDFKTENQRNLAKGDSETPKTETKTDKKPDKVEKKNADTSKKTTGKKTTSKKDSA